MASIFKGMLLSIFISHSICATELRVDGLDSFLRYAQSLETSNPEGLYLHQRDCLRAIARDIHTHPYGFVEMATGTGKQEHLARLFVNLV